MYKEVDGRWGRCKFFAKDEYVGRSMYHYGEYNPDETEKILELAGQGGGWCMDIGANIGVITQALINAGHWVKAFEPQPEVYKVLCENIWNAAIKKDPSVTRPLSGYEVPAPGAVNAGVGATAGTAKMPRVHYSDKCNVGGLGIGVKSPLGSYDVPIVAIDDEMYMSRIGFMKIDVEGYELEVLKGATRTITSHRPILYIEDDRLDKSRALRAYITQLGYTIEEHKPTLYRENNYFGLKRNVWDKLYASHNLVCRPMKY